MGLVHRTNFGKYSRRIKGLFYTHLQQIVDPHKKTLSTSPSKNKTTLSLEIGFCDNSVLKGLETIINKRDVIEVIRYSYKYQHPSGFFFRYEMEEPSVKLVSEINIKEKTPEYLKKPYYHLHIGAQKEIANTIANFPPGLGEHKRAPVNII